MVLKHCITDVSTTRVHSEVKRWTSFIEAIGQLRTYNYQCPREELYAFMFDETCGQSKIETAMDMFKSEGIKVFTFTTDKDKTSIIDMSTQDVVFSIAYTV